MINEKIRNIAIIAHVDHGKTTLVDALLKQSHIFRENEQVAERIMDSNDLEKERGITILSKNTSVMYNGIKINIVDTPGHADFGGEVERVLKTVDGVLLLVDAFEGPMPQTREVLKKSLALNLKPIVVINKIDRPGANPEKVVDQVIELFIELNATDEQLDFPVIYASAKNGIAKMNLQDDTDNINCIFETIIKEINPPACEENGPVQMLVSNIDYDDYVGRIAVGRLERGIIKANMPVAVCKKDDKVVNSRIVKLYTHVGLNKVEVEEAKAGDIIEVSGIADINIGETICAMDHPEKIDFVDIDEPTVSMTFSVNNGPLAGREGQFITSRHIRDRLFKELERNVSLRVKETDSADSFEVSGRGELHLSVLIETMRREGFELLVSRPKVIFKEIDGVKCEPIERLVVNVPDDCIGNVIEKLGKRKAEMVNMEPAEEGHTKVEFKIPARGLIGYRTEFMTDTKGNGTMNHIFDCYEPYKGDVVSRVRGTIVAFEAGKSVTYGLYNAQDKGDLFIGPGVEVYEGMIVGINSRPEDLAINVCKEKHLTNTRASGSDDALRLVPPIQMSLEKAIEFIQDDELVEITPKSIRLRKKILDTKTREREARRG
ncbi:MAG TPA: translational GTPase TypA [Candidatus Merdicola faecigallinarum]|uniref:Large ribosomal subunit assembly factor BipA n=1 Tax=Candidatus Merdicola faecigallinarum TaxID=2840862 RepID=A0A9D1S9D0_9FIRM|nr:translational GTPase TypA [Candidatus Merdicola faecigallinarum]